MKQWRNESYCSETFSKFANKPLGLTSFLKMCNIIVWNLQLQIITLNGLKNLKWLFIFTFLNKGLICSIFLMNQFDPCWISVITKNCFVWKKIREDIFNCFCMYIDLFVKDSLLGLRQFLATERPSKQWKMPFHLKSSSRSQDI